MGNWESGCHFVRMACETHRDKKEFHDLIVYGGMARLDNETLRAPHRFINHDVILAIGQLCCCAMAQGTSLNGNFFC